MSASLLEKLEIEQFLIKEAALLDQDKLTEWLELYSDDSMYWIPCGDNDIDPDLQVSIIYDDRERLGERVWRLQTGLAYGQEPKSKVCRLISNVDIVEGDDTKKVVASNFIMVELRRSLQTIYAGRYIHHLVKVNNQWKIEKKKVELIQNNEFLGNLSFIL